MPLRKYLGVLLSLLASTIAMIFSLPVTVTAFFTWLSNRAMCWAEDNHIYSPYQVLLGVHLDDLRCMRCTKLIFGKYKDRAANEVLNINLVMEDLSKKAAAQQLIDETRVNREED